MTLHDDRTFMRHFSWVLVALVVITIFFIFIAFLIVGETGVDSHSGYTYVQYMKSHQGQSSSQSASKGNQSGNGKAAAAAAGTQSVASNSSGSKPDGETIWKAHCAACHASGVAGAPKIGDTKEWKPILAETSKAKLYDHAINGFKGKRGYMPPKGGASGLSDAEVKAAVDYMVGKSGG